MLMFSARSTLLILSLAFAPWFGTTVQAAAFNLDQVAAKARELAQRPYTRPPQVPEFMRTLSYDEFRSIRFDPQRSLWQGTGSRFEVMLMVPGLFFTHQVKINVIDGSGVTPLAFNKEYFQSDNTELFKKTAGGSGLRGLQAHLSAQQAGRAGSVPGVCRGELFPGHGARATISVCRRAVRRSTPA
jgi:periplasmic glucans biosynthesis protein